MAEVSLTTATNGAFVGPGARLGHGGTGVDKFVVDAGTRPPFPLLNEDLSIFRVNSIDAGDTFTPFAGTLAGTGGVYKSVYDYAFRDATGVQLAAVWTPATASAPGFFTFACTAGAGFAFIYVWAK